MTRTCKLPKSREIAGKPKRNREAAKGAKTDAKKKDGASISFVRAFETSGNGWPSHFFVPFVGKKRIAHEEHEEPALSTSKGHEQGKRKQGQEIVCGDSFPGRRLFALSCEQIAIATARTETQTDCYAPLLVCLRVLRAFAVAFCFAGGCAHEQVPAYPPMSQQQALSVLRERSHAIRTISAQGLVTLTRGNGDTVRLDAVVLVQPPDKARLRAWKFSQAVFDMTLTSDGLWMIAPQNDEHRQDILAAGPGTGRFIRQWMQFMTGSFDAPGLAVREQGDKLVVTQPDDDDTTRYCEIDRKTLTPRRYVIQDRRGAERFTLALGDYAIFGGIPWPRKIEAVSDSGRILIELRDVELNGDLPPGAFHPPARAEKLP